MSTTLASTALASYLLSAAAAWSSPEAHDYRHGEVPVSIWRDMTIARYESIAQDLADVALEEEPVFGGETGRAQTALLALAIASYESGGFRGDVDQQETPTGDGGHAWCLAQVHLREGEKLETRKDCFRIEFQRIRESWSACRWLSFEQKLAVYASGSCTRGRKASETRVKRATEWWAKHPLVILPEVE